MNKTNNNCAWCGSCEGCEQNSPAYKVCAKCKAVFYCSRECQINDWKKGGHKDNCNPIYNYDIDLSDNIYTESPFSHCQIDNFLNIELGNKIHSEILTLNINNADSKFTNFMSKFEYNKFAFENINKLPLYTKKMFEYLNSKEFIAQIEKLTGIHDIIYGDVTLRGAGIHMIKKNGRLSMHTDFNTYYHKKYGKLDRRINLLLYMNKDWDPSYKGDLILINPNTGSTKRIEPIFNRCVIFNTTNKSIHGHPEPLNVPDDNTYRKSLAVYYYTKSKNINVDFEGDAPHSTLWYGIKK